MNENKDEQASEGSPTSFWEEFKELVRVLAKNRPFWAFAGGTLGLAICLTTWVWHFVFSKMEGKIDDIHGVVVHTAECVSDFATKKYPNHGLIATFPSSSTSDIRTSMNEQLSLLSDSAFSGRSVVHYERITHVPDGDGYLRMHYHLNPKGSDLAVPYVGVYANFSNPVRMYDLSQFAGVDLTLRLSNTNGAPCKCYFQLCDANVNGSANYAWSEVEIPTNTISGSNFVHFIGPFARFKTPEWSAQKFQFDSTRVFRFIIKILGQKDQESAGILDIDDIRFY